jgi:F0F1-type ATP synthase gamma subunit
MNSKKQILAEREGLLGLKNLVEVYQEVAAARMQKVRGAVLQSRMFMQGLLTVFKRVRAAYKKLPERPKFTRRLNGRTVAVFVSANAGLYGDIVDRTFGHFSTYVRQNKSDVVILGRLGVKMMADGMPEVLYNYFDFSDETIDMESFDMIMRYLIQFEQIVVFHGQFKTILSQDPTMTPVSGEALEVKTTDDGEVAYLFEPSVEDIARIFEGEILASIFEQTLHESMLAKFASRMLTLDRSIDSIEKRLTKVKSEERIINHKIRNRKQLNTISGISLWS